MLKVPGGLASFNAWTKLYALAGEEVIVTDAHGGRTEEFPEFEDYLENEVDFWTSEHSGQA